MASERSTFRVRVAPRQETVACPRQLHVNPAEKGRSTRSSPIPLVAHLL